MSAQRPPYRKVLWVVLTPDGVFRVGQISKTRKAAMIAELDDTGIVDKNYRELWVKRRRKGWTVVKIELRIPPGRRKKNRKRT